MRLLRRPAILLVLVLVVLVLVIIVISPVGGGQAPEPLPPLLPRLRRGDGPPLTLTPPRRRRRLRVYEQGQRGAEDGPRDGEGDVDGDGVVVQGAVGEGVEGGLDELARARDADDGAVDAAKGGEAKDFGGVVAVFFFVC